ncbi:hypothetical protein QQP08_014919, partial [Theobroma cacao]
MEDVTIVEKILCSLTPKFDFVIYSIEESKDIDALSLDELQSALLVHEQKRTEVEEGEREIEAIEMAIGTSKLIFKVECFRCHKSSHYHSECYTKLLDDKETGEKSNFTIKKEVETLLMTVQVNKKLESNIWYVDTSCNNHMSG